MNLVLDPLCELLAVGAASLTAEMVYPTLKFPELRKKDFVKLLISKGKI